jgi:hypothetical protein
VSKSAGLPGEIQSDFLQKINNNNNNKKKKQEAVLPLLCPFSVEIKPLKSKLNVLCTISWYF